MVFALPVFVVVGAIELARRKAEGKPMPRRSAVLGAIGIGLIGYYLAMVLDFAGLLYVTAQLERLALFTYPIFLIFIGAAFFGMRLTRDQPDRRLHLLSRACRGLRLGFLGRRLQRHARHRCWCWARP